MPNLTKTSPISSNFVEINHRKIHFLKAGSGPPLILLHAYLSCANSFRGVIEYLATNYTVYAPDLPGFGLSDELPGKPNFDESSSIIAEWIKREGLKNFTLVGISLGGVIATNLVSKIDSLVRQYILIEPFYGYQTLLFPPKIMLVIRTMSFLFNCLPRSVGNLIWSSDKLLLLTDKVLNPFNHYEVNKRSNIHKLDILHSARYQTFWHTLELILRLNLDKFDCVSLKPAVLLMSPQDDSLDFQMTLVGYQRIFPKLTSASLDLIQHYPTEPLTADYIHAHFPNLMRSLQSAAQ